MRGNTFHLPNQHTINQSFFLLFLEGMGAREADDEGCDEKDGESQQKGFVSPQRDFVSCLCFPSTLTNLDIYCFRLPIKSCVKDRTPLISYMDIFDYEMLYTAILARTTEPREKSQKILKWKRYTARSSQINGI